MLVIVGILLFGPDKLPDLARKVARVVSYVRNIANSAQTSIQSELGPGFEDFDIRDPKGFIRKKITDQMDPITADVKSEIDQTKATFEDTTKDFDSIRDDLKNANSDLNGALRDGSQPTLDPALKQLDGTSRVLTGVGAPFDTDAT